MKHSLRVPAFSLLEILAVVAIIGILATISFGPIRNAQIRNRDTKRKADLQLIAQSLEAYYVDRRSVPGIVDNCPVYDSTQGPNWVPNLGPYIVAQAGGVSTLPRDPRHPDQSYTYQCFLNDPARRYQLQAKLENTKDRDNDSNGFYTIER
jgi:prepilin-type N-terminal cleavage/methylation domain-containing protein